MARSQPKGEREKTAGLPRFAPARPLDSLIFLLPLIVFYEVLLTLRPVSVIAYDLLRHVLEVFGRLGLWAPGAAVVVILLATHVVSGRPWSIRWRSVAWMNVESTMWAVPLLALNWATPLSGVERADAAMLDQVALGIGAGVYEELVFRLIAISLIVIVGADLLRLPRRRVAVFAVLLSALVFAAHHHPPIGTDPFDPLRFAFRTVAGLYLATVFWFRGYGPAAGCHAVYNTVLVLVIA